MVSYTIKIEAEIQREREREREGYHGTEYWDCTKKRRRFCDSRERNNKVSIVPTKTNIKN